MFDPFTGAAIAAVDATTRPVAARLGLESRPAIARSADAG